MGLIVNLQNMLHRELRVALRGGEALVSEQFLDGAQVCAFFQHVRAERVAQRVRMHVGGKALGDGDLLDDASNASGSKASAALVDQKGVRVLLCLGESSLPGRKIRGERGLH